MSDLCFVVSPFGEPESEARRWSDFIFETVIAPVVPREYRVQRTIDDPAFGSITDQIERDLKTARVVIADLSGANPNVYFELGFRHALERPFIHIARAGTALPFDVSHFSVIWIHADYVAADGMFRIADDRLEKARSDLRAQLDKVPPPPPPPPPALPVAVKVYQWEMFYSASIAEAWLAKQSPAVRREIARYERGDAVQATSLHSLALFAEYQALKGSAGQSGEGTIFATVHREPRRLDFGYAVFKFANAVEPILIDIADVTGSGTCSGRITFKQHTRPFRIKLGARRLDVLIPGYKYDLQYARTSNSSDAVRGTILHPRTHTLIGDAELTPR